MTKHNLFYHPSASFTNAQRPLLNVAALWFEKLVLLDPVGASWDTVGADHIARETVRLLNGAGSQGEVAVNNSEARSPSMGVNLFSDLIDALGKTGGWLKSTASLPKSERDRYRQVLDDTCQLIHATLTMIILRLGDILRIADEDEFLKEVDGLENYTEWMETERKFRLCQSLRVALRETEGVIADLRGRISTNDWDTLLEQMRLILRSENEPANYIGQHFADLAFRARDAQPGSQTARDIRAEFEAMRAALKREREQLLGHEAELLDII
ncbi:MAG: hypothetical protein NNA25_00320 [Nitrospira sp.]|nr:hypothetical protein [Nitrospira sp.]